MSEPIAAPLLSRVLLDGLEWRWRRQGAPLVDRLRVGLEPEVIEGLMAPLGLTLPAEAWTWWGWRDGVSVSDVTFSVERSMGGPDFEFLPLAEAVELYRRQRLLATNAAEFASSVPEMSSIDYWWHECWFPLAPTRYGGVVACDCRAAPDGPTPIHVIEWEDMQVVEEPSARSVGTMVEWWLDALDRGAWRWNQSERRWLLDYDRLEDPARELTRLV